MSLAVPARANPHADELDAGTPFNWRMYLGFAPRTRREFENSSESIAGHINHCPVRIEGEPEIPWEDVQPYNRSSRCLPRASEADPWVGNEVVGQTLRDGGMTDVAAHLTTKLMRESAGSLALALLAPTGKHGALRVDQGHVTAALAGALTRYGLIDPGDNSDHYGIGFTADLNLVDERKLREYT